jgi:hypothetical protein
MRGEWLQADNERSFKILHEYLDQALQGGRDSAAARVPYRFCFHVRATVSAGDAPENSTHHTANPDTPTAPTHDSHIASEDGKHGDAKLGNQNHTQGSSGSSQGSTTTTAALHTIEMTLPPPAQPLASGAETAVMAPSVRAALARLFTACGVEVRSGMHLLGAFVRDYFHHLQLHQHQRKQKNMIHAANAISTHISR